MQKLTGADWLQAQIKELEVTNSKFKDIINQIIKIKSDIVNEFGEWTPLKLMLLNYALNVCTTIISKCTFFKKRYYIDLFAGSGINKIKDKPHFLIGSPLIAALNHSLAYSEMIFCERNPAFSEALDLRLKMLKQDNLIIMRNKYEDCLNEILKKVNKRDTYSFFFIDPNSTEFAWKYMEQVLKTHSDIIFTFMSFQIQRIVGYAKAGLGGEEKLNELFGDTSWKKAKTSEELVEIYKENILKIRKNAPIRIIKIQSQEFHFDYYLFFITNPTKKQNPWLNAIDKAKEEIEKNSDIAVRTALLIIKKIQTQLSQF